MFSCGKVNAEEYIYENGTIKEVYSDVTVNSFKYDYKTTFTAKTGYYNGEQIYDNGEVIDENKEFYSGRSIEVVVKHVDEFWAWNDDDDNTIIYKYNFTRKDFSASLKGFYNEDGKYTLKDEGLYKIVYTFEGKQKYFNYIYITSKSHEGKIVANSKYDNVSAFVGFSFKFSLKDAYDLRGNKYYYAFGENESNLEYTEFEVFGDSEKKGSEGIFSIQDRELVVDILEKHEGKNKKLFVKVVKENGAFDVFVTDSSYAVVTNIEAYVYLKDEKGELLSGKSFKKGDVINLEVVFNTLVVFENLQYSIDGGNTFFNVNVVCSQPISFFNLSYKVSDSDFDLKTFDGKVVFKTKNSKEAYVNYNGQNVSLKVEDTTDFKVDMELPLIQKYERNPAINGEVGDITSIAGYFSVEMYVEEYDVDSVYYYVAKCNVVASGVCFDSFNENNSVVVKVSRSDVSNQSDNVLIVPIVIDQSFGNYNDVLLNLFVKVVDRAGNISYDNSEMFKVDNVVISNKNKDMMFLEKDIIESENVVGKKLFVATKLEDEVVKVFYKFEGFEKQECQNYFDVDAPNDVVYFECFGVDGYDFSSNVTVEFEDVHGNKESYEKLFVYSTMVDGFVTIKDLTFTTASSGVVSINLYNEMSGNNKLVFDKVVVDGLTNVMKLSNEEPFSDLVISLVLYGNMNEEIVLVENILDSLTIPTTAELLEKLSDVDSYKSCALHVNKCDINLAIKYEYKFNGINQERYVKLRMVDNYNKYVIDVFNSNIVVKVNETFNNISYKMVDNLNREISSQSVSKDKKIVFTPIVGDSVEVEFIDTTKLGVYKVVESYTYNGVGSFPLEYVVSVVDNECPVVRLNVDGNLVVKIGQDLPDHYELVNLSDNYDKKLTLKYEFETEFNKNVAGKYIVKYWTVDSSGNSSEIIELEIIVEHEKDSSVYWIVSGIITFVVLVIVIGTFREIKKEKRK